MELISVASASAFSFINSTVQLFVLNHKFHAKDFI